MRKIILASASPRRKELLENIGLKFEVCESKYEEKLDLKLKPHKLAEFLSLQKAKEVAKKYKDEIIIAADTLVVLNDEIIGKPKNDSDARKMLWKLSGKSHFVITGFTIIDCQKNKVLTKSVKTKIYFRKLEKEEIENYIKLQLHLGKAGGYGIQDKAIIFIEKITGDFFNVVGLPLPNLMFELKKFGIIIL